MKTSTHTATQILRDMIYSLLESGFKKQDVAAALDKLASEAKGDHWEQGMERRERTRAGRR